MAEWKASITPDEFASWVEFYRLWPFDDVHRYHRPAALVASFASIGMRDKAAIAVDDAMQWLQPQPETRGLSKAARNTLQAFERFGLKPPPHRRTNASSTKETH